MKFIYLWLPILLGMVLLVFAYPSGAIATSSYSLPDFQRSALSRAQIDPCENSAATVFASEVTRWQVNSIPTLSEFAASVTNGDAHSIVGVYVCGVLALEIVQQPVSDPVYVSTEMGTATQFRLAAIYGTLGLLAHNDRSGLRFFGLRNGQEVDVVYGDGTIRRYRVKNIRHFKPINSGDPYSDFIDVDNDGAIVTSSQVFQQIFVGGDQVVFQTCIFADGNPTWGRLFVIATPVRVD